MVVLGALFLGTSMSVWHWSDAEAASAAAAMPQVSGVIKALKGPAGEVIGVVEVNGNKEALVFFKNVAGPLKGTTKIYQLNDMSSDSKDIFYSVKRGSKTKDINVLTLEHGAWTFINPGKAGDRYPVYFSDKETAKMKESDFLSTLKP
jgi:hypothetical protein